MLSTIPDCKLCEDDVDCLKVFGAEDCDSFWQSLPGNAVSLANVSRSVCSQKHPGATSVACCLIAVSNITP